jgi:hypothetical protein
MADRMLLITWGPTVRGREARALEVFNEALGLYGRMQQDGQIEAFDVAVLDPNTTLNGYIALKGSAQQISALRLDSDFRRLSADAALIVEEFAMIDGACEDGVASQMAIFQEAIGKVPQHA